MPTYTYRCTDLACNLTHEVKHGFSETGPATCPCGSPVRKVFSAPAIEFKGSGFYRTDSRAR